MTTIGDLPSAEAAKHFAARAPGATGEVVLSTLGRGLLIAAGLHFAGFRGRALMRATVASTLTIEMFVLGWAQREAA